MSKLQSKAKTKLFVKETVKSKLDVKKDSNTTGKNKTQLGQHHGYEDHIRKAAEEEAERQRQAAAAAAAEEARLAAIKEEMEYKQRHQYHIPFTNDEEKQKDLMDWVKSVPLSQRTDRLDRAFSDGSLVAEIIHYFCPDVCDKRQYFKWNSRNNKLSNWEALNHRVFPKLGFRLNQKQINNLLSPFACGKFQTDCEKGLFIFKLLDRIRAELAQRNSSVFEYRNPNFVPKVYEKKRRKRKLVSLLEHPAFSRVEMLIDKGFYDKDEINAITNLERQTCAASSKSEGCFPSFNLIRSDCLLCYDLDCSCSEICVRPTLSFKLVSPVENY